MTNILLNPVTTTRQHWFFYGVLLAIVIGVGTYYVAVKGENRSAINRWRPMIHDFLHGADIYQKYAFPTPPIMALLLVPFCLPPGPGTMLSLFVVKVLLAAWSYWQVRSWLARCWQMMPPVWLEVLVMLIWCRPVLGDLLHGNINLWILFLVILAWHLYQQSQQSAAGLTLALAIACKVTPLLLLVYFVWQRAWQTVLWTGLGLILWLIVVPSFVLGPARNGSLLLNWYAGMVAPYVQEQEVDTEQVNQSLPALIHRFTTPTLAIKPDDGRPPLQMNWVNWSPTQAQAVVWLVTLALLVYVGGSFATAPISDLRNQQWRWCHELAMVLLLMLLLSERSWKHHYVTILPSVWVLLVEWYCRFARPIRTGLEPVEPIGDAGHESARIHDQKRHLGVGVASAGTASPQASMARCQRSYLFWNACVTSCHKASREAILVSSRIGNAASEARVTQQNGAGAGFGIRHRSRVAGWFNRLLDKLSNAKSSTKPSRWLGSLAGLAVLFAGLAMATTSKDLAQPWAGPDGSKWMQAYGVYVWAALVLLLAHGTCLRCSNAISRTPITVALPA